MPFETLRKTEEYKELKKEFSFLDDLLDEIAQDNIKSHGVEPLISKIEVENKRQVPEPPLPQTGGWDFHTEVMEYPSATVHLHYGIESCAGFGEASQLTIVIYAQSKKEKVLYCCHQYDHNILYYEHLIFPKRRMRIEMKENAEEIKSPSKSIRSDYEWEEARRRGITIILDKEVVDRLLSYGATGDASFKIVERVINDEKTLTEIIKDVRKDYAGNSKRYKRIRSTIESLINIAYEIEVEKILKNKRIDKERKALMEVDN